MTKNVLVPIADGTEELEAVCIIDVLRRAGAAVTVASVSALEVTASRGVKFIADQRISDCIHTTYELIALPGGIPGAEQLRDCQELTGLLRRQRQEGRYYAAICAAPVVVLQHHGLLGEHKATCHPAFAHKLTNPDTSESPVVVDGMCITSRGAGTALGFALKLTELLFGKAKADEVSSAMVAG